MTVTNITKKVSDALMTLPEVCNYYGQSESTVRRRIKDSREGRGNFPLPLFRSGCRVLWKRSDIENWNGEGGETITITPSPLPSFPKVSPFPSADQTRRTLAGFGIDLPPPTGMKPAPIS